MTTIRVPGKRGKFKEVKTNGTSLFLATCKDWLPDPMDLAMDAIVDKWRWWEAAEIVYPCSAPAIDMEHWADEVVAYLEIVEGEL